ncbi:MAG: hypothetical protein L3K02_02940 [Thermoplasmata archaeon]|nr:hypothetical protein [Thermoplasmata archaeon]
MSIELKPFPTGVDSQNVTLRAVLSEDKDHTGAVLRELRAAQGKDPKAGLGPQDCRVVARTAVAPVTFRVVGGFVRTAKGTEQLSPEGQPVVKLTPPNDEVEVRFSESDPELQIARLFKTAERIRNFLAFCVGQPVPLAVLLASGRFLNYVRLDASPILSAPQDAVQGDAPAAERWYASFRVQYQTARQLLTEARPPEPIGRALSLVGEGLSATDPEERFFYCWRALEVIGHWDLSMARTQFKDKGSSVASEYFEAVSEPLLNSQYARLDAPRLVEISVRQRGLAPSPLTIAHLYQLRSAIAHGDVTPEETLEIMRGSQEIFDLAHASVALTLDSLKSS